MSLLCTSGMHLTIEQNFTFWGKYYFKIDFKEVLGENTRWE